ncbi:hypothetical protein SD70_22065 [Gordoniibacillus kamchatkensis]|uniref:Uncharacterized protein n=1 Tax=Gordoniibacillus kamchatkensis TaxID=1590651 RepID=A0ABR5ADK6_9BACL|nr:hypothetical protein SD70_22065 [Paenibacillus sp. VKM B-2647]
MVFLRSCNVFHIFASKTMGTAMDKTTRKSKVSAILITNDQSAKVGCGFSPGQPPQAKDRFAYVRVTKSMESIDKLNFCTQQSLILGYPSLIIYENDSIHTQVSISMLLAFL